MKEKIWDMTGSESICASAVAKLIYGSASLIGLGVKPRGGHLGRIGTAVPFPTETNLAFPGYWASARNQWCTLANKDDLAQLGKLKVFLITVW